MRVSCVWPKAIVITPHGDLPTGTTTLEILFGTNDIREAFIAVRGEGHAEFMRGLVKEECALAFGMAVPSTLKLEPDYL